MPARDYKAIAAYAQSVRLDDLLGNEPSVDFVKMDIEGHEPFALRGLDATLRKHNPTLLTEFSPDASGPAPRPGAGRFPGPTLRLLPTPPRALPFHAPAEFDDADAAMDCWHERDVEIAARGILPAGAHHFDLVATNRVA